MHQMYHIINLTLNLNQGSPLHMQAEAHIRDDAGTHHSCCRLARHVCTVRSGKHTQEPLHVCTRMHAKMHACIQHMLVCMHSQMAFL